MLIKDVLLKLLKPQNFFKLRTLSVGFELLTRNMYSDAYFRWKDNAPQFDFSFYLENKELGVSRNFNFSRQITETIGDFQNRVRTNLDKTLSKKKKKKSKQQAEDDKGSQVEVIFSTNGSVLCAEANCKDSMYQGGVIMKLLGQEYAIHVNSPWIVLVSLPDSMLAGFPTYPCKVELEFAEKSECQYTWYRGVINPSVGAKQKPAVDFNWVEVGHEYCFTPTAEDIGCQIKLKCTPMCAGRTGPPVEVVSRSTVGAGPGPCPFETRHSFTQEWLEGDSFRIVTYNLLADLYADSDYSRTVLYPHCPPYAIALDYRKQLILKELIGYHGDILCLQEVDGKVFDLDLSPALGSLGYQGLYSKKGGQVTEGLACFFRSSRFELLSSKSITLGEEIPSNPIFEHLHAVIKDNDALKARILDRGTILQTVILRHRASNEVLVLGLTHLYFHPDADHVRLLQAATCLGFLQHILEDWKKKESSRVSLILCGDFNSTPEFGVYKLMTTKHIPTDYPDWSSNAEEAVKGLSLSHELHMESACGRPKYTNFTVGFADCLDYIFYQTDRLRVTQVVPLPSEEELRQHTALPSVVLPSDHVALVADLAWTLE